MRGGGGRKETKRRGSQKGDGRVKGKVSQEEEEEEQELR